MFYFITNSTPIFLQIMTIKNRAIVDPTDSSVDSDFDDVSESEEESNISLSISETV